MDGNREKRIAVVYGKQEYMWQVSGVFKSKKQVFCCFSQSNLEAVPHVVIIRVNLSTWP